MLLSQRNLQNFEKSCKDKNSQNFQGEHHGALKGIDRKAFGRYAKVVFGRKVNNIKSRGQADPNINKQFSLPLYAPLPQPPDNLFMQGINQQNAKIKRRYLNRKKVASSEKIDQRHGHHDNRHNGANNKQVFINAILNSFKMLKLLILFHGVRLKLILTSPILTLPLKSLQRTK